MGAERKLLDNAVDRTSVQYDSWMDEETSFWMDRNHTNSNLQYRLLMQNLQELETSLAGKDLKMLENDIFVRIEQLGALRSFTASMTRVSVKVNPPRLRKSRKASSSQFISEWKSHPRRRRSIVREQSALLETIKERASLEKMREKMVKEGQEVSYHRWAEGAGVDCGRGKADEQAAGRILLPREAGGDHRVARQVHCKNIHRDGDGLGQSASDWEDGCA